MGVRGLSFLRVCSDFSGISFFGIQSMLSPEDLTEKYSPFTKKYATEGYIVIIFIKEANE